MTATRDRQSDLDDDPAEPAWDERPIVGTSRGLPWWGAVLLAFGLAALAAMFDMQRQDALGRIYQGAYVLGCVVAVCWVRRRNLFGPMVQPPLVFAVTAIGAVVLSQPGSPFDSGLKQLIFSVALPLTSNFPTMAITTGVTVAIGLLRMYLQRDPTRRPARPARPPRTREPLDDLDSREPRERRPRRGTGRRPDPDQAEAPPRPRRLRDRPQPDRTAGRSGRSRLDPEPPARQRNSGRPDPRDQPPRRGRGRPDPGADRPLRSDRSRSTPGSDPAPRRQPGMRDDRPRRTDPAPDQPRRRPRRRPDTDSR